VQIMMHGMERMRWHAYRRGLRLGVARRSAIGEGGQAVPLRAAGAAASEFTNSLPIV
jgi:hypothetical protein